MLGTQNSYHVQSRPSVFSAIRAVIPQLADALQYSHAPLDQQFESQGVRAVELDVFADPAGGLYANRAGARVADGVAASGIPELSQPGFKVFHVQDLDFDSTCWTFVACLQTIKSWSDAHPGHLPIMILVEAKDETIPDPLGMGFVLPLRFDAAEFDALDAEIRSVFPAKRLITPDDVRGGRATLEDAVLHGGWPALDGARGKVYFALDNGGPKREAYLAGHPSLKGRVMFTNSRPGQPDAAFVLIDDPVGNEDRIRGLVADGYIVGTRADADTAEARTGDTTRREAALASGAQVVSTDYPVPDAVFGTGYAVSIPGGSPARCNPVNAPPACTSVALERPQAGK